MAISLKILLALGLALVGSMVFEWGLRAIRNRSFVKREYGGTENEASARRCLVYWTSLTLSVGTSMMVAAVVLWFNPVAAAITVACPIAAGFVAGVALGTQNRR